jgi:uncharacterized protein (TIGR03083 family)
MTQATRDAISALRQSHDQLVTLVQGFGPGALGAPSGSSEWAVADVLGHLGSAAEIGRHTLTTGKADLDGAPAIWDRWNAMSPADKASNSLTAGEALVEAFESLDDDALANRKIDVGFLPAPIDVAFLAAMRLSEVGLHTWDIDVAFDPAATVTTVVVPFVLDQLPLFAGFFAKPTGSTGRIAIETTDPARTYVLELHEDGAALSEGQASDARTSVTLPAEALLRLTAGRLAPDHTPASVRAEGDLSLDDLRHTFPGY